MEAQHVNDPSCDPYSAACRGFAHVAIQQRMGLLSERRIGFGGSDPASACLERKVIAEGYRGTPRLAPEHVHGGARWHGR
jgi:hypothetical protein